MELKNDANIINNASGDLGSYLADVIYCGDKTPTSGGTGVGTETNTLFGSHSRLTTTPASPTLVCPGDYTRESVTYNQNNLSKYTAVDTINGNGALNGYKIGLLSADEVAFAGGKHHSANSNYYLYTGSYYWIMSPSIFYASTHLSYVFFVNSKGSLDNYYASNGRGVRPVISLIPTVTLSNTADQDGTANHPYEIN